MTWQLLYSASKAFADSPFRLGLALTNPLLIVRAASIGAQPSWSKAGTLFPIIEVTGVGVVEGIGRWAYLRTKMIRFESLGLPFDLEFRSVGYLSNISLFIWQTDEPPEEKRILDVRVINE